MIVKAVLPIPFKHRLQILFYGGMFVSMNYKGKGKPLKIEAAPVNIRKMKREKENASKNKK